MTFALNIADDDLECAAYVLASILHQLEGRTSVANAALRHAQAMRNVNRVGTAISRFIKSVADAQLRIEVETGKTSPEELRKAIEAANKGGWGPRA